MRVTRVKKQDIRYSEQNPPTTLEIAENKSASLLATIQRIDTQLGSESPDGEENHKQWRRSALDAKRGMLIEYRFLKAWIKKKHFEIRIQDAGFDPNNPDSLIHAASNLFQKILKGKWNEIAPEDQRVIRALQDYIEKIHHSSAISSQEN